MSKWYSFKELKRARTPMLLDSETGLPDNHVITVVERVISVDDSELIQNNVRTDTFTLNLDAEYDDLNVVVIFTKPNNINVKVAYNGTPTHIPGSAMELVGSLACSVVGIDADGEVRAVTKAAPDTFQVVKSGAYDGSVTSDDAELLGQILQAVSDAETAITAAESATTAATNATSQATSAATSANQAASSANSAASSANSAATKANSAAMDAQNAYDTLQPYMATIDSCANILHREVGPDTVVTADDAFPCKPVEMIVYGNTVQNLWVNPSGTSNGVTVTANDDGSFTLSGTASNQSIVQKTSYVLAPGKSYRLSIDSKITDDEPSGNSYTEVDVVFYNSSDTWLTSVRIGYGSVLSATFSVPADTAYSMFRITVKQGDTVSGTYRVMLNEGSTAEPWCPPGLNSVGDGGNVQVVTAGKNLFGISQEFSDLIGWSATQLYDEGDGWVRAESSAGAISIWYKKSKIRFMPTTYTVSFEAYANRSVTLDHNYIMNSEYGNVLLSMYGAIAPRVTTEKQRVSFQFTLDKELNGSFMIGVGIDNTSGLELHVRNLQLELGSTATDYEPPNITTTPIDLQGHTLNALPDGTRDELHIDGGGNVVLEKRTSVRIADTAGVESSVAWRTNYTCTNEGASLGAVSNDEETYLCDKFPQSGSYPYISVSAASGLVSLWNSDGSISPKSIGDSQLPFKVIYKLAEPQTIDLGTITPPTMAAPNVTAYVADDTPAEMELDYVRDINIVVDRLEKKVADLAVMEATNV